MEKRSHCAQGGPLTCVQQHFDTVGVVVGTGHVQRGPIVEVVGLQTGVRGNQELHTVCVPWRPAAKTPRQNKRIASGETTGGR